MTDDPWDDGHRQAPAPVDAQTAERQEIDQMTESVEELSRSIDQNLRAFKGQFARLSDAILDHTEKVRRGEVNDTEITAIFKRVDPVLNLSIQQETRLNDKLAERVGQAGKFAIDFNSARSEIRGRLARLRNARRARDVSGGDE